jgi:archaellum component FlaG (FlaF/FlaG flagellin family)
MRLVYGVALLAVLFAAIGVAYSLWSEQLTVKTIVNTGEVKVAFDPDSLQVSDQGADPQAEGYNNNENLDVANAQLQVTNYDDSGNAIELTFTIDNAYPGYQACATFNVKNIGSIPVDLTQSSFTAPNELTVTLSPTAEDGIRIDPGDSQQFTLCVTVNENAQENSQYNFDLTLGFTQWNGQ